MITVATTRASCCSRVIQRHALSHCKGHLACRDSHMVARLHELHAFRKKVWFSCMTHTKKQCMKAFMKLFLRRLHLNVLTRKHVLPRWLMLVLEWCAHFWVWCKPAMMLKQGRVMCLPASPTSECLLHLGQRC